MRPKDDKNTRGILGAEVVLQKRIVLTADVEQDAVVRGNGAADFIHGSVCLHSCGKRTDSCSKTVDKEFAESDVLDALIVATNYERSHGDDILLIVVLDFLQTSELALAGLV